MNQQINIQEFTRIYACSTHKFTDTDLFGKWVEECGIPETAKVDFIGPHAFHNLRATALRLGQSLTEGGKVLFINVDNNTEVNNFVEYVNQYRASTVTTLLLKPETNGLFTEFNSGKTLFEIIDEPLEKDMDTVETADFNNPEDTTEIEATDTLGIEDQHILFGGKSGMTFSWDKAKHHVQNGNPVRRLKHGPLSFVGFNEGKTIPADGFWVEANKQAAIANGGFLTVKPYYTFCDGESVDMAYRPTMEDELALDWTFACNNVFLEDLEYDEKTKNYLCHYQLHQGKCQDGGTVMVPVYDLIANPDVSNIIMVSGDQETAIGFASIITDMKHKLFGSEEVTTSEIVFGDEQPYDSKAVNVHFVEPGLFGEDQDQYDLASLSVELVTLTKKLPGASILIDLKGVYADKSFEDLPNHFNDKRAVEFANNMRTMLMNVTDFKDTKWAIIDLHSVVTSI